MSVPSQLDPSDFGEDAHQGDANSIVYNEEYYGSTNSDTLTEPAKNIYSDTVSMTGESRDGFENAQLEKTLTEKTENLPTVDEDARMLCNQSPDVNSPRDIVSPTGELSSPFSAMESDGEGMETGFEDASLSAPGDAVRRPTGFFGASSQLEYTTTPGASSSAADDNYESSGSRKKRRKTRRDMHPSYNPTRPNGPMLLRFPKPTAQITPGEAWHHDPDLSPFSPPTCPKGMNFNFAESSSRRSSSGAPVAQPQKTEYLVENAKRTKTCDENANTNDDDILTKVKTEITSTMDTPVTTTTSGVRRRHMHTHHRTSTSVTNEDESTLHKQYPRKVASFELRILSQPETQHRARYLTEGSRGPVKDLTQQGFPKVQLIGYKGHTTLQVFVATDSGKVKPHGFYQACRVTGRNTSPCEEVEIEGTKVIEIPFKQDDMVLSVDCVGILKLRNTDVEVRTGLRNQKRNQSVRLVFRVVINAGNGQDTITLQTASNRVSCTQPLGQPEITKKSLDKCSVEGGIEMFIIGKNFHRGTRVIYQDPEDPNGKQWSADGEVDKDTFHQSHMVVRVPPYHDLDIVKPVNVQLLVEFQDKRCEPHSFTYIPREKEPELPKEDVKKGTPIQDNSNAPNIESALSLLDGPIDKKFLVALFSKLLAGGITAQNDSPNANDAPELPKAEIQAQPPVLSTTAPASQSFINPTSILQGTLQTQQQFSNATEMVAAPEQKPNLFVPTSSIPVTNPFANIQFIQRQEQNGIPFTQTATNINPTQFLNFANVPTSQVSFQAFPTNTNVNIPGGDVKVKSEIEGPELVPTAVVTTTIPCTPIMAAAVNQSTSPNFASPLVTQQHVVISPQVQNSPSANMVISPGSQQGTQPDAGAILYNSLSATTVAAQATICNNFAASVPPVGEDNTLTKRKIAQPRVHDHPADQVIFGVPQMQQGASYVNVSAVTPTLSPTDQLPKQPQPVSSFQVAPGQQNIPNMFSGTILTQQQTALPQISNQTPVKLPEPTPATVEGNITTSQPETMLPMAFETSNLVHQSATNTMQSNMTFQNTFESKNQEQFLENPAAHNTNNGVHNMVNTNQPNFNNALHQFTIGNQDPTMQQQPSKPLMHVQQVVVQSQGSVPTLAGAPDAQMHVDPFVEVQNTIKMQTEPILQSNSFSPQQVTQMATVNKIQPMEEVSHSQTGNQVQQMKETLSPQQIFHTRQQAAVAPMVSDSGPAALPIQGFQNSQPTISLPTTVAMQQISSASIISGQNFQTPPQSQQANNINMVVTTLVGQTLPTSQSVETIQAGIVTPSVPAQIFQTQPTELMTSALSSVPMQTQPYQPTEPVSEPVQEMLPSQTTVQQPFQNLPAQNQQPSETTSSAPMQMTNNYIYPANSSVQITPPNANDMVNTVIHHPSPNTGHPLEQRAPDLFAMDQLLQSIDGSENLATITGEDVRRQFQ